MVAAPQCIQATNRPLPTKNSRRDFRRSQAGTTDSSVLGLRRGPALVDLGHARALWAVNQDLELSRSTCADLASLSMVMVMNILYSTDFGKHSAAMLIVNILGTTNQYLLVAHSVSTHQLTSRGKTGIRSIIELLRATERVVTKSFRREHLL